MSNLPGIHAERINNIDLPPTDKKSDGHSYQYPPNGTPPVVSQTLFEKRSDPQQSVLSGGRAF
jgi:hypothetical protein